MNRVARVTAMFWLLKICATTLGETAGDLLSMTLGVGYAASSIALVGLLGIALAAQLRARRFHAPLYWCVILLTSTAGTTMSDFMDRTLGLGYARGAALLLIGLLVVLAAWRWSIGSLRVDRIESARTELFYWTAILFSNTLGTALGDYLADSSGLGFMGGALLIGGTLGVLLLAYAFTRIDRVALFWGAFVLTRPFGATFGDLLTKLPSKGGLGFGTIGSSLVLALLLVGGLVISARRSARAGAGPAVAAPRGSDRMAG